MSSACARSLKPLYVIIRQRFLVTNWECLSEHFNELVQVRGVVKVDHTWYFASREKSPLEVSALDTIFVLVLESPAEHVCLVKRKVIHVST